MVDAPWLMPWRKTNSGVFFSFIILGGCCQPMATNGNQWQPRGLWLGWVDG
ncbi:DNA/RNA helicase superfamily II [Arthrospira platensis C1]|nr:DNA/RNA helicase superfamily II [Arthrospira platensis C1]